MNNTGKNILIGLFVLAAIGIFIYVLLFLHPKVGDRGQVVTVRFANVDKVNKGTRVTYGGKPVGEVLSIRQLPDEERKPGKDGYVYLYELKLGVDSKVHIYNTDQISARTSGLLGEKNVEISPGAAKPGEKVFLTNDKVLFANETGSVEETLKVFKDLSDKIEATLDSFKFAIDDLNRQKIWEKISRTVQNISDITDELNKPEKWKDIMNNLHQGSSDLVHAIDTLSNKADTTLDDIRAAVKPLHNAFEHTESVAQNIAAGRGTLGNIIMNDDIYLRTASLMGKAETIMDDINHYGILFQNDKRWQRMRARRANLLTKLCSPQEFRNYFNDELDEITTSLSRLSMVLQDTECDNCYQSYMDNSEFRKVFAELLRRVVMMEESLKLYNTQVVERDTYQTELCPER
jgi:phospholipid/cholesterol/gamma-HCH transport system substrate-binding protein